MLGPLLELFGRGGGGGVYSSVQCKRGFTLIFNEDTTRVVPLREDTRFMGIQLQASLVPLQRKFGNILC